MRTKGQQDVNHERDQAMIADVKNIIARSSNTVLMDFAGAGALTIIFAVALSLPNLF